MTDDACDALVCGGGPAGAVAALVLARAGWRVALADAGRPGATPTGESLPPAAAPLLRDLGLSHLPTSGAHLECPGNVVVWGNSEPASVSFIRSPDGPGWHLDRPRFDADLRAAAAAAGARVCCDSRVSRRDQSPQGWEASVVGPAGERRLRARWLIDATGRRGECLCGLGVRPSRRDRLVATVAVVPAAAADFDQQSWVEAAEDGWWYTALAPGRVRVLAHFTDADLRPKRPDLFARLGATTCLRRQFVWRPRAEAVRTFAAHSATRAAFAGPGWLAVGDATLAFDPLSSQGLFHALYTGLRGAEAVLAGDGAALAEYEARLRGVERAYLRNLTTYYRLETRWPGAAFWRRRLG